MERHRNIRKEGLTFRNMKAVMRLLDEANNEQLLKIANESMARSIL